MKWACIALVALAAAAAPDLRASDTSGSQAVIETRRAGFKKMGAAMKALTEQLKTGAPDAAKVAAAVQAISTGAEAHVQWFPQGSGPEAGIETDALPHIWKDRAKFDSLSTRLIAESKTLTTVASGTDVAALRTQFKAVADACSTCHKSFRAD